MGVRPAGAALLVSAAALATLLWWLFRTPALPAGAVVGPDGFSDEEVRRGEYLVAAAGCAGCHTDSDNDGAAFAGGLALETPYGTFYASNITPDPASGIGGWSLADFVRSLRLGVGAHGQRYWPAFPYTSYSAITPQDMRAMYAYLRSVPPASSAVANHELPWYLPRAAMAGWQKLFFRPRTWQPDPTQSEEWNRGAYLVRALGHCGECHTPRNAFGALREDRHLAGTGAGPDGDAVPNITSAREAGIGTWSRSDLRYFLEEGLEPDGDFTGGSMVEVIEGSLQALTREDREAIVTYLRSVPPLD